MSANDIESGALADAEAAGAVLARVQLLRREFGAIMKIGEVLRKAIEQEEALGVDIGAGFFEEMLHANQSALRAVVRELGRVAS